MGLSHSPSIITENLEFYIDPSNTRSYPGFGNTIYNIVNSSMGCTFVNFTANPIDNAGNRSIFFDNASNNAVFIPSSNLQFGSSDFTIQFWFKFPGYSNNNGKVIFSDSWGPSNGGFLFYTYQSGGTEKILFYSTSTDGSWNIALEKDLIVSPSFNTWYNVAVTRTGNIFTLYANGQITNTFSSSLSLRNTGLPYSLGASPTAANASKCSIGSVFIYRNKGLSAAEINQNYHATKKKYLIEENIVTDGLVLKLDAGNINSYAGFGTVWNDLSGFGNTFYLFNGPTFSSVRGGAITFDGTNDYARSYSNSTILQSTTTFTVDLIFKYKNTDTNLRRLVGFADLDNSLDMWITSSTRRNCFDDDTGFVSFKTLENNDYTHLTYIVSPTEKRLYFNGILDRSAGGRVHVPSTNFISIASVPAGGYNCNMDVNLLQIYNRALTQQEILQNYNATKNRFVNALPPVRNGLVLELDALSYSGFGNTWYNLAGSGLNGTLTNGIVFSATGNTSSFTSDGVNDRIDFGTVPANTTGTATVGCWVKTTTTSTCMTVTFESYGSIYINRFTTGKILAFFDGSTGNNTSADVSNTSVNDGKWHYLAATNNGTTCSMYIDGVLDKTYSETPSYTTGIYNQISGQADGNNHMNGSVGFAHIYNRALSAYKIKQNFDYYRTRYGI